MLHHVSRAAEITSTFSLLLALLLLGFLSGTEEGNDDASSRVDADSNHQHLTTPLHHVRACNNHSNKRNSRTSNIITRVRTTALSY